MPASQEDKFETKFEKLFQAQREAIPDDFILDSSCKETGGGFFGDNTSALDFSRTGREDDVIKAKEAELLQKAKELEGEMLQVRQAKVNSVLRQFEQQLQRDARLEHQRVKENLEEQYTQQINGLEAEKNSAVDNIEKLQKQLQEQISFFTKVRSELETKKSDLQNTYQASV